VLWLTSRLKNPHFRYFGGEPRQPLLQPIGGSRSRDMATTQFHISVHPQPQPAERFGEVLGQFVSELKRSLFDHYRPECHYMRGPGPRSRAVRGAFQADAMAHEGRPNRA
jgi:hypothetical protein